MCVGSRNNTKTDRNKQKGRKELIFLNVSCVTCCMWHVACHLSLTPTATATNPPLANFPIMNGRLVPKITQTLKNFQNAKNH